MTLRTRSFGLILVTLMLSQPARAQGQQSSVYRVVLSKIAETYEIEIAIVNSFSVKTARGPIDATNADSTELRYYTSLFAPEFSLYPTDLVKRSGIKRVVLCKWLSFAGRRVNALPDLEHETLFLDVSPYTDDKTYTRKAIHHEFFHLFDNRVSGNIYQDERWSSLNPAKFKYGKGGWATQNVPLTSVLTEEFPGFLNHYSTSGVEEDKAEVFANLIVEFEYVDQRVKSDRILKAKVERMKEQLARFCPKMNDEFWEKVRKVKRPG